MLAIGCTYDHPGTGARRQMVLLQGGPYVVRTIDGEGKVEFSSESAMTGAGDNKPAERAIEQYTTRCSEWAKAGFTRNGEHMQVEISDALTTDTPEQVIAAYIDAASQPLTSFSRPHQVAQTYTSQMAQPARNQARTDGRRRVRVEDRSPALTLDDNAALVRPNGETYLPRRLFEHTDVAVLRRAREANLFPLLSGPPGGGKTALTDATFPDLVAFACHGEVTVPNLVGAWQATREGGWEWIDGPLTQALRDGRVLLLDEIDRLPYDVMAILHPLLDGRGELRLDDNPGEPVVKAAAGFFVVGTYNPATLGGQPLPEALLSRFPLQIEVHTDYDAALALGVPEDFVKFARQVHSVHETAMRNGDVDVWVPQMRELLAAKRLLDAGMGLQLAVSAMIDACPIDDDIPQLRTIAKQVFGHTPERVTLGAQVGK